MKYVPLMKYVSLTLASWANARDSSQKSLFNEPSNARRTNCGGRATVVCSDVALSVASLSALQPETAAVERRSEAAPRDRRKERRKESMTSPSLSGRCPERGPHVCVGTKQGGWFAGLLVGAPPQMCDAFYFNGRSPQRRGANAMHRRFR